MKNTSPSRLLLVLPVALGGAAFLTANSTRADVLADYDFTNSTYASSAVTANLTASDLTTGGAFGTSGTSWGFSTSAPPSGGTGSPSSPTQYVRGTDMKGSESGAVTANEYFAFTLTPGDSSQISLASLSFDYSASSTHNNNVITFFVRSSLDNFTADLGTVSATVTTTGSTNVNLPYNNYSIALSGLPQFQGIGATGVTFELFMYNNAASNADSIARFDNLIVNGTISAIPEPANSVLLTGIAGALGVIILRRRLRRRAVIPMAP